MTMLLVWFKLLSFFRGFRGSGVFTRLVLRILYEIRYFLLVWIVILLGFANAYMIVFQGNNLAYLTDPSADLHFVNLGDALVNMFKGSIGGGLDLVWRGDVQFPNGAQYNGTFPIGDSNLYNLQLVLYIMFSLVCNVLLLNLLIAQMSSVYDQVNHVAAAQYRLDKAKLMIGLEASFLRFESKSKSPIWLHVVAPKTSSFWEIERTGLDGIKDHIDIRVKDVHKQLSEEVKRQLDEIKERTEVGFKKQSNEFQELAEQIRALERLMIVKQYHTFSQPALRRTETVIY